MNLDSVFSIRVSRTVSADHTVRWEGEVYRIEREQITAGMRGARVQVERRRDGSHWTIGESERWHWNTVNPHRARWPSRASSSAPPLPWRDRRRRKRERNSGVWRAVNDGEKASTTFAATPLAGGKRFSPASARASIALSEGQGIQTPSLAPRAPPSGFQKRILLSCGEEDLLLCVDSQERRIEAQDG